MTVKISIITVVYNGGSFFEEAIKSVVNQNYSKKEYIIIDGGSTDQSLDIIKKYQDKIDTWVSEPDNGIYHAINKGIRLATGNVIGILNSDDILNDGVLERVTLEFEENPSLDYLYGYVERMNKTGEVYGIADSVSQDEMIEKMYKQIPIPHGALMAKKNLFDELGYYNTEYIINSDYDFILKLIENNKIGKKIELAVSRYRDGGISSGYLTFWERKKLLKNHGVSFIQRGCIIFKAMSKLFFTQIIPKSILSLFKK